MLTTLAARTDARSVGASEGGVPQTKKPPFGASDLWAKVLLPGRTRQLSSLDIPTGFSSLIRDINHLPATG